MKPKTVFEFSMEKTLYLTEKEDMTIMRDGPSIWVRTDGTAGRRIPARTVDKVIVVGNVKLDTEIITLFASHKVPMVFVDKKGEEIAVSLPRNERFVTYSDEQALILATEKNIRAYHEWWLEERRKFQLEALRTVSENVSSSYKENGFSEQDYQTFVMRTAWKNEKQWNIVDRIITAMSFGLVLCCLVNAGLDPHMGVINRRRNYGMVMDIRSIIDSEFDMQAVSFFNSRSASRHMHKANGGWQVTNEGMRDIAVRYETRKQVTRELTERAIDSLFAFMRALQS